MRATAVSANRNGLWRHQAIAPQSRAYGAHTRVKRRGALTCMSAPYARPSIRLMPRPWQAVARSARESIGLGRTERAKEVEVWNRTVPNLNLDSVALSAYHGALRDAVVHKYDLAAAGVVGRSQQHSLALYAGQARRRQIGNDDYLATLQLFGLVVVLEAGDDGTLILSVKQRELIIGPGLCGSPGTSISCTRADRWR